MKNISLYHSRIFWLIMCYGLVATCWNLAHSPAFNDEAINIFMGRQILEGQYYPFCDRNDGSVLTYPVLAALGDRVGGIAGARAVGAVFALGLAGTLYLTGRILFSGNHGFFSAILFFLNGTILYLSTTATGDMVAAFFLGLSFLLLVTAEKQQSPSRRGLLLFAGALSLFVSSITTYTVVLFIPPLVLYVFWKHTFRQALSFFFVPLSILLSTYIYFVLPPDSNPLEKIFFIPYGEGFLGPVDVGSRIFRLLGMPYLLAFFGLFHEERKGTAFLFIALSTPLVIHHVVFGDVQALERDVVYSIVFLVPAMALGVDHMGTLFSSNISLSWVKPFFTVTILIILWVFGIYESRWLQMQRSDLTPVFSSLNLTGFDGMTVAIDADHNHAEYLYRYSLEDKYAASRFIQISDGGGQDMEKALKRENPDFVIIDRWAYGNPEFVRNVPGDIDRNFSLVEKFDIPFLLGVENIKIFRRR